MPKAKTGPSPTLRDKAIQYRGWRTNVKANRHFWSIWEQMAAEREVRLGQLMCEWRASFHGAGSFIAFIEDKALAWIVARQRL